MTKKLDKAKDTIGPDTLTELEALSPDQLKSKITEASEAMRKVAQELDDNPKYQDLKENLKALSEGKRETNRRQNAVILVCLSLLNQGE